MTPQELKSKLKCAVAYGEGDPPEVALEMLTEWLSDHWEVLPGPERSALVVVGETLTALTQGK